jgi:hypothetical protein
MFRLLHAALQAVCTLQPDNCRGTFIPPPSKSDCSLFSLSCILNHVGLQTVHYWFPVSHFTLLTNLLGHTGHRAMKTYPEDKLATEEMDIE